MLSYIFWTQSSQYVHKITCATSHSGRYFTGSESGEICFWEESKAFLLCSSISNLACLFLTVASCPSPFFVSCKTTLISLHEDMKLRSWSTEDGRCLNSQKLCESVERMHSCGGRILAAWNKACLIVVDVWTFNTLKVIRPSTAISQVKIISDTKIVMLTHGGHLKFWNCNGTSVNETPYFVYFVGLSCLDFYVSHDFSLICMRHSNYCEFKKLNEIKYENQDSVVIKFENVYECHFYSSYFFVIDNQKVFRFNSGKILENIGPVNKFSLIKEIEIERSEFSVNGAKSLIFCEDKLIGVDSQGLCIRSLENFDLVPKILRFSIESPSIPDLDPDETVTFSSLFIENDLSMLIGTSKGSIILKPLTCKSPSQRYSFSPFAVTCVYKSKDIIISCDDHAQLAIHHETLTFYCELLSPASQIIEVNCIQDTMHNVNDTFWKNSWKNWNQTVLVHSQDSSISLVSLLTNSVTCYFVTKIPHISEVTVHVLLEYLMIRSHEVVYIFNMMMQCLERIVSGIAAKDLLRKETQVCNQLSSNSSEDFVCEEHRVIEINCRSVITSKKGVYTSGLELKACFNPTLVITDEAEKIHSQMILSLLTCWDNSCSSHLSLMKAFPTLQVSSVKGKIGIKGDSWQSFLISTPSKKIKYFDSLVMNALVKMSTFGCPLLKPSIGVLAMKAVTGSPFATSIIRDLMATITPACKEKMIAACKSTLKLRTMTSETLKKASAIIGKMPKIELESEWTRSKSTLAECQSSVILIYFASELKNEDVLVAVTSLLSMLRSSNQNLVTSASKAIIHTYSTWTSLILPKLKEIIEELILLSINFSANSVYYKTIGTLSSPDIKNFLNLMSEKIYTSEYVLRNAWLNSLKWISSHKYDQLIHHLPLVLEIVLKTLNPHNPTARKFCLEQASEILQTLVQKLPMVSFSQAKQKIAIGTMENSIVIYDLKTATLWKCLEGHEAPVSAVIFSKNGESLVSYSAQDFTLRVWKVELGFFQGLMTLKSAKPSTVMALPQVKRGVCTFKEFLDCVSMQWNGNNLKLVREDLKTYGFSLAL